MRKFPLILTAAAVALASQSAMAYKAGDIYARAAFEKTNVKTDNISDENGAYLAGGYLFHDNIGVELGLGQSVKHDHFGLAGNDLGTMKTMPVNLLVNYYPLGGLDNAPVQPFVGLGLNYTRFSSFNEKDPSRYSLRAKDSYGVVGQVGVDLKLYENLSATGYARWADVSAEVENHGNDIGKLRLDPLSIGAGLTYRF
ncbi:OmpW/AlkL family protein [Halomonas halocynthiae]|uniref:OmpW/AlkL family protein n=1 Tax=Halomonas halocynthiae TaxID=176290 RepID=UPI0004086453|nr:OmpW family outer membrane protein [Halomonas halocynthiae]